MIVATMPQVFSIEGIQWTPYVYRWDGATWQLAVVGETYSTVAYPLGDGWAEISGQSSYLHDNNFSMTQPGTYQVWDYVTWSSYPGTYAGQSGGVHILETISLLWFGQDTVLPWCTLDTALGGKRMVGSPATAPHADAPPPRPPV